MVKILGIIGIGRIGQAFARRAKGFDMMDVYYYDVNCLSKEREKELTRLISSAFMFP